MFTCVVFCTALLCPALVPPTNGGLVVASQAIGSVASYSCKNEYQMVEGSASRTCEEVDTEQGVTEAAWSGSAPKCGRCSVLSTLNNVPAVLQERVNLFYSSCSKICL